CRAAVLWAAVPWSMPPKRPRLRRRERLDHRTFLKLGAVLLGSAFSPPPLLSSRTAQTAPGRRVHVVGPTVVQSARIAFRECAIGGPWYQRMTAWRAPPGPVVFWVAAC